MNTSKILGRRASISEIRLFFAEPIITVTRNSTGLIIKSIWSTRLVHRDISV